MKAKVINYAEGIINYDKIRDRVQCPICKMWFKALLSSHVPRIHKIFGEEFKEKYGLNRNFGVVCIETRNKHRMMNDKNLLKNKKGQGNLNLNKDRPRESRKQRVIADTRRIVLFSNSKEEKETRRKRGIERWNNLTEVQKENWKNKMKKHYENYIKNVKTKQKLKGENK